MKEILGKQVYDSIEEMVRPDHTALIVVDMQNDYCSTKGAGARQGSALAATLSIVEPLGKLIEAGRRSGVRIVYLQNTVEATRASLAPAWVYYLSRRGRPNPDAPLKEPSSLKTVEGTWGHEIIPGLAPQPGDFVVRKNRPSGYTHTNLDKILRANGVESVIITGVRINACVLATARDAQFHDYYAVIVRDCVAGVAPELDDAAMTILRDRCDFLSSEELVNAWAAVIAPNA